MNVGHRFGKNSFKADLALRYETVLATMSAKFQRSVYGLRSLWALEEAGSAINNLKAIFLKQIVCQILQNKINE